MQQLSYDEFLDAEQQYNSAVAACPGIDPYCSLADWILPFHEAFSPEVGLHFWRDAGSFIALSRGAGGQPVFSSIDTMWGFASALVGPRSPAMLGRLCRGALRRGNCVLYGLPPDRRCIDAVARCASRTHSAFLLEPVVRCVASLDGGLDGFLSRRARKFRLNARRALERAGSAGLRFSWFDALNPGKVDDFYERVLDIERRSWKGLRGEGADQPPMREFYRLMLARIGPAGMLRAIIAELDGEAVGYIYGAFIGGRFRGLQFSFDDRHRSLSIGNVLQLEMIERLSREQAALYDLGMRVPYKKNWAEMEQQTHTVYLRPL